MLKALKADDYTVRVACLVILAESRFKWNATSTHGSGRPSEGLFQQTLPWWDNDHFDIVQATTVWWSRFRDITRTNDPIEDAWKIQQWAAPNPSVDLFGFRAANETKNYTNVLPYVNEMIRTGEVPNI